MCLKSQIGGVERIGLDTIKHEHRSESVADVSMSYIYIIVAPTRTLWRIFPL